MFLLIRVSSPHSFCPLCPSALEKNVDLDPVMPTRCFGHDYDNSPMIVKKKG